MDAVRMQQACHIEESTSFTPIIEQHPPTSFSQQAVEVFPIVVVVAVVLLAVAVAIVLGEGGTAPNTSRR